MRGLLAIGALVSVVLIIAPTTVGRDAAATAPMIKTAFNKTLKRTIVVDGSGRTVYMFTADTAGSASCTVQLDPICPRLWPPVKARGAPVAGRGIVAAKLTTIRRSDGVTQVAYNRHPLYYFSGCCGYGPGDKKPGHVRGQRVFDVWFVLSPTGRPIRK